MINHEEIMKQAIAEAMKAKGQTGENPIVGAVIVEDGNIVARGYHKFFGGPHAEIECLKAYQSSHEPRATNHAVLYVTLEPCCTVGKTGKCTDAIIASGIKKVVVGAIDPNPKHQGKGIEILRNAEIEVTTGVLTKECEDLNPEFNRRMAACTAYNVQSTTQKPNDVRCTNDVVLFDTHCHIYYDDFDADRDDILTRAKAAGVDKMLCVGVNLEISKTCLEYAEKYPQVYASAGVHPTEAHKATEEDFEHIEKLLHHPKVIAIGEVGLDFYHKDAPKESQEKVFIRFLEMQKRVDKPLILHCRDAFPELIQLLRDFGGAPYRGIFHCFSGDAAIMKECLELGFHISFAGPLTYKKNDALRKACHLCPADRVLIETDCPYLPPQTMRGKRNEPAMMVETAKVAAEARGEKFEFFARQSTENALKLFRLQP